MFLPEIFGEGGGGGKGGERKSLQGGLQEYWLQWLLLLSLPYFGVSTSIHFTYWFFSPFGSRVDIVVIAFADHQWDPGSILDSWPYMGSVVVGSLLCSKMFFSGISGFPLCSKTNISNSIGCRPSLKTTFA